MHWLLPALVVSASVTSPSIHAKSYRVAALLTAVSASGEQRFRLLQVLPKPLHGILSKLGAGTDPTADGEVQQLPDAAYAFVGNWKLVEEQNYAAFLEEAQGLPWMKRKLAEHIHPTPNFYIEEGTLHCKTICVGAKPVHEILKTGPTTFHEPSTRQKVYAFFVRPVMIAPHCSHSHMLVPLSRCRPSPCATDLGEHYAVTGQWEGEIFVATRRSENGHSGNNNACGHETVQRRWIDPETGHLVVEQDWGGNKPFIARYEKQPSS